MSETLAPILHGGRLRAAARHWHIPVPRWLDLSTGINPQGWPVPAVPPEVWQRLPEDDDGLYMACTAFFGTTAVLPVAGSQAAIMALPRLWTTVRVAIVSPTYAEHAQAWRAAGHAVTEIAAEALHAQLNDFDVVVVVNPDNPTGMLHDPARLREWHADLSQRGGTLIVDEAFIDATPQHSLLADVGRGDCAGLILLRSLGKFWGLAGVRCGFVLAESSMLARLAALLGPWAPSHPARWVAQRALADREWQTATRSRLMADSERLAALLEACGLASTSGCALFRWAPTPHADRIHESMAQQAVLLRKFDGAQPGLRIGLPGDEAGWEKLAMTLRNTMESLQR